MTSKKFLKSVLILTTTKYQYNVFSLEGSEASGTKVSHYNRNFHRKIYGLVQVYKFELESFNNTMQSKQSIFKLGYN